MIAWKSLLKKVKWSYNHLSSSSPQPCIHKHSTISSTTMTSSQNNNNNRREPRIFKTPHFTFRFIIDSNCREEDSANIREHDRYRAILRSLYRLRTDLRHRIDEEKPDHHDGHPAHITWVHEIENLERKLDALLQDTQKCKSELRLVSKGCFARVLRHLDEWEEFLWTGVFLGMGILAVG